MVNLEWFRAGGGMIKSALQKDCAGRGGWNPEAERLFRMSLQWSKYEMTRVSPSLKNTGKKVNKRDMGKKL